MCKLSGAPRLVAALAQGSFESNTRMGVRALWGITRVRVAGGRAHWPAALREQLNEKAPYLSCLVEFQGSKPAPIRGQDETWRQLPSAEGHDAGSMAACRPVQKLSPGGPA
jgi:hypothetical protein